MIINSLWPGSNDMDMDDMWFQKMALPATLPYSASHDAPPPLMHCNLSSRLQGLTTLDYFLWSFLELQVYANRFHAVEKIKIGFSDPCCRII